MRPGWRAYRLLLAVAMAVYFTMVLWSLPRIAAAAGGLVPFDLRPGGYTFAEAQAFVAVLDPGAVRFYLRVQHGLDTVYPPLLALVLGIALWALLGRAPRWLKLAAMAAPGMGMVFDWVENARVAAMLRAGAQGITPEMVAAASGASRAKAAFSAAAMMLILALLLVRGWRRLRHGGAG